MKLYYCCVTNVVLCQFSLKAENARIDMSVTFAVQLSAVLSWLGGVPSASEKKQMHHKH
jgi:hypothetical protein